MPLIALLACVIPPAWIQNPPPALENNRIRVLLQELGADSYDRREEAERELMIAGRAALTEIERALSAQNLPAERRKTLEAILEFAANVPPITQNRLRFTKVSIETQEGETMAAAFANLMAKTKMPIQVVGKSLASRTLRSVALRDVPLEDALNALAAEGKARWTVCDDRRIVIYESQFVDAPGLSFRIFDVAALTSRILDFSLPVAFPRADVVDPTIVEAPTESSVLLGGEELVDLIRNSVEPDRWDEEGREIFFQNGLLGVRTTAEIQDLVAAFLKRAHHEFAVQVRIELMAVAHHPAWMQRVLSRANGKLSNAEWDAIRRGAAEGKDATVIGSLDLTGFKGQQVVGVSGAERALVTAYREDGAPCKEVVMEGVLGAFRPMLSDDRRSATVRIQAAVSKLVAVERLQTPRGEVQVPRRFVLPIRTAAALETGTMSIVASSGAAQGFGEGRTQVVVFLRITPVVEEGK